MWADTWVPIGPNRFIAKIFQCLEGILCIHADKIHSWGLCGQVVHDEYEPYRNALFGWINPAYVNMWNTTPC